MKETLNDKLLRLNTIQGVERKELRTFFLIKHQECNGCDECILRYHIIEEYENLFLKFLRTERRRDYISRQAYDFVVKHYVSDGK